MGFSAGIVGLPNIGKSTLFNALSKAQNVASENYPFCTIDPNKGIIPVPDDRMDFIIQYVKPKSIVPTTVEFVDIAGLVKGASKGEGLGNKFLTDIRQTDAIIHLVRAFDNDDVHHVEGSVDPARDIDIINTELVISDMEILERALAKYSKTAKSGDKSLLRKAEIITELLKGLNDGLKLRSMFDGNPEYEECIKEYHLLTAKPILYLANVNEEDLAVDNEYCIKIRKIAESEGAKFLKISAKMECELQDLSDEETKEYLESVGINKSGLENLILNGYALLGLVTYFTAGEKEVRAWTITTGMTAKESAGKIHSDIERGFIRADVCSYADFVELKSLTVAKEKGKLRVEGKEYIVKDGDIIYFRFNV